MNTRRALAQGGFAAAACVACCAPPLIAAFGLTAGLAAAAGIFFGLAAAIAVLLAGGTWIVARARSRSKHLEASAPADRVPVAAPARRATR